MILGIRIPGEICVECEALHLLKKTNKEWMKRCIFKIGNLDSGVSPTNQCYN